MILDRQFYLDFSACAEGYQAVVKLNLLNLPIDEVVSGLQKAGLSDYSQWLVEQKSTELYVRANGGKLKMNSYQVFNTFTGQHERYESEEAAKAAALLISRKVLEAHAPTIVQEIANENGDVAWVPLLMPEKIQVFY